MTEPTPAEIREAALVAVRGANPTADIQDDTELVPQLMPEVH